MTRKKRGAGVASVKALRAEKAGLDYLRRTKANEERHLSDLELEIFGKGVENGLRIGSRLGLALKLLDRVEELIGLPSAPDGPLWNLTLGPKEDRSDLAETDPVLSFLGEADREARDFLEAAEAILAASRSRKLGPAVKKFRAYLSRNRVIPANRQSFTARQGAGLYVAQLERSPEVEKATRRRRQLQPREFSELLCAIEPADDEATVPREKGGEVLDVSACAEILAKSRRVKVKPGPGGKPLLVQLEQAVARRNRPPPTQDAGGT